MPAPLNRLSVWADILQHTRQVKLACFETREVSPPGGFASCDTTQKEVPVAFMNGFSKKVTFPRAVLSAKAPASSPALSRPGARLARGFTRLELLVAVAIISVVSAMALPMVLTVTANSKLRTAMLSASGAIQSVRYQSISTGMPYQITFNHSTGAYLVSACSNCAASLYTPTSAFTYAAVGQSVPFSTGTSTNPTAGALLSADQTFYFRPGGAVQWVADGTTSCTSPLSMTFTYQGVSKTMTVECYGKVTLPQ